MEKYTAREETDLVAVAQVYNASNFWTKQFRENGFFILLRFPRCSRWYLDRLDT